MTIATFADLIAPVTPEEFFRDYYGRKWLHIPGAADKFAGVLTWAKLERLLNMTAIWTSENLGLRVQTKMVPPQAYCVPEKDRRDAQVMQPDPAKVMEFLRQGASLALNRIDTLDDGLRQVGAALEQALFGRAQANLYASRKELKAFDVHYDTHDVFAIHCEGEKDWCLYETMEDNPINHPVFNKQPHEISRQRAGKATHITMKPGDLLYIPRGLYHDALSSSDACFHVAYGVTTVIGYDVMTLLMNRAVTEGPFRRALPRPDEADYDAKVGAMLNEMGDLLKAMASDATTRDFMRKYQTEIFRTRRGGISLPVEGPTAAAQPQTQPQPQPKPAVKPQPQPARRPTVQPGMQPTVPLAVMNPKGKR